MAFPVGWPPRPASGRRSMRFEVAGTGTANFQDNAFLFRNANQALAVIGPQGNVNGQVFVTVDAAGPAGNSFTIAVVVPATGGPQALAATITAGQITVSLATDASNNPIAASNTATLVAAAITALAGVAAIANGTGASSLDRPEARKPFFFGGGMPVDPTPGIQPGQSTVVTTVGTLLAGGSPMGAGYYTPDVPPEAMVFSFGIRIVNTGGTAIEFSFDGFNIHGIVGPASEAHFEYRHEAGIAIRGASAFRVEAW